MAGVLPALGVVKAPVVGAPGGTAPAPSDASASPLLATGFDACADQEPIDEFFTASTGVTFAQGIAVNLTDSWDLPSVAPTQWMVASARTIPDNPRRRGLILSIPSGFSRAAFVYSTYATIAKFKPAEYGVVKPVLSLWSGEDPGAEGSELLYTTTLPLTNETLTADRTPIMWNFHPVAAAVPEGGARAKSLLLTGTIITPTMGEDVFYLPTYVDDLQVWA